MWIFILNTDTSLQFREMVNYSIVFLFALFLKYSAASLFCDSVYCEPPRWTQFPQEEEAFSNQLMRAGRHLLFNVFAESCLKWLHCRSRRLSKTIEIFDVLRHTDLRIESWETIVLAIEFWNCFIFSGTIASLLSQGYFQFISLLMQMTKSVYHVIENTGFSFTAFTILCLPSAVK